MDQNEPLEPVLLEAALKLADDERGLYLDRACAGDLQMRRRVQLLLEASERAGAFMKEPVAPGRTIALSQLPAEKPGDRIGRYKLLEQIGEGGCGLVYVAEQEVPVRRRVALKVIKLGMDTKQVIARFDAERQALAMMDHPNIAKVLDAGATENGRSYFVMELVHGIRITEYCDQKELSPRERLELFVQVCRAVQHAHQKGIIHRDIKPSNILVASSDGVAVPKVIDFGIAKATQGRLTDQTIYTAFEQFIGTPAYMSPEQAEMSLYDIDTRTDIYSLGVLLYELITGKTPFDAKEVLAKGLDEMRRTIREVEPVKPSTRLTQARAARSAGSAKSKIENDLDWIVMKCLEKDRTRRYETANGLATDIGRHLNSEPVVARPPSRLYRFQKTVQRNKLAFGAATAVALALVLGVIVSTWQAIRATQAERQQSKLREQAQKALGAAERQRQRAEQNAEESRTRLQDYADVLCGLAFEYATGRAEPHSPEEALPLIRKALEVSGTNVIYVLTLGQVYSRLDREQEAIATFERAIHLDPNSDAGYWGLATHYSHRPEDPVALEKARSAAFKSVQLTQTNDNGALNLLARIYSRLGLREEAILLFRWSVQLWPEKLFARNHLAWEYITGPKPLRAPEKALPLIEMSVELTRTNIYEDLCTLGVVYGQLGQFQQSVETIEKGMRLPGSSGGSAENYFPLAVACYHLGQFAKAEAYYEMGRSAVENGDTFLTVGTLRDAERFRMEAEEQLGKRKVDMPLATGTSAAPDSPATNAVALTPAEIGLLEAIRKQLTNTMELSRSEIFARALNFPLAINEFSEEVKTNGQDMLLLVKLISLLLETGDLAAYRERCHEALLRFATTQNLAIAQELAGACLLAPLPAEDTRQATKLADFALSQPQDARGSRQAHFNKALADFRLGRWLGAVEGMNRVLADTNPPSPPLRRQMIVGASATLAMAHEHLGDLEARQRDLARATKPLNELWHAPSRTLPHTWHETLVAHALLREAETLIERNAAITDDKKSAPR